MRGINSTEQELMGYISEHKIINTHSHHLPEQKMMDFDLDKLLGNSYLQWQQITPGTTAESRTAIWKNAIQILFCLASKSNR